MALDVYSLCESSPGSSVTSLLNLLTVFFIFFIATDTAIAAVVVRSAIISVAK